MSDGITDCARTAHRRAKEFIDSKYPRLNVVTGIYAVPKKGKVVLLYEEWIKYVVEIIEDRVLKKRYVIPPFRKARTMPIGSDDWQIGYYRNNHLPK